MRNLLFILLLLPMLATAQRSITKDSTWITNDSGNFFSHRTIEYDNGESQTTVSILGDTIVFAKKFEDAFITKASSMATDARAVSGFRSDITELIRQASDIEALVGDTLNPLKVIAEAQIDALTDTNYVWGMNDTLVEFSITNALQGRYVIDGYQKRNCYIFGDVVSLVNFKDSGTRVDLFRVDERKFQSIDGSIKLVRRNAASNRIVMMASSKMALAPPEELNEVVYDNAVIIDSVVIPITKKRTTWSGDDEQYIYKITRRKK